MDDLLTHITVYWTTSCITTSVRLCVLVLACHCTRKAHAGRVPNELVTLSTWVRGCVSLPAIGSRYKETLSSPAFWALQDAAVRPPFLRLALHLASPVDALRDCGHRSRCHWDTQTSRVKSHVRAAQERGLACPRYRHTI